MGQLLTGLLRHHIASVPVWPVRITPAAGTLFVLAVRGLRPAKRARQIVSQGEGGRGGVDAAGQPGRDLLEEPAVPVRISERGERAVAAVLGIGAVDPDPPKQVRLVGAGVAVTGAVENVIDLDAATEQTGG